MLNHLLISEQYEWIAHIYHSVAYQLFLVSIVVSIPACHAGDRGSIPRQGVHNFFPSNMDLNLWRFSLGISQFQLYGDDPSWTNKYNFYLFIYRPRLKCHLQYHIFWYVTISPIMMRFHTHIHRKVKGSCGIDRKFDAQNLIFSCHPIICCGYF